MATLTALESAYLNGEPRLARLATVDADGQPHVVPVGWRYDEATGTFTISGRDLAATRKFRNVLVHPRAALVVDDVLPPWRARGVLVQGPAQALPADDAPEGRAIIRLTPTKVTSWGLDGSR
ncbi:pyridoxamine 5'-phosphate oxidase family protein [Geodermatophilus obscurus]|uniref:Pyridoxamine 5'-phosphate oxidase family protein n=1 Tax=Geodermatophilus obscurus TaxID=1861 RepID=A0A1M7RXS8_9ACTN|nr:PPOX class F420-dependent oxidoreductase [Geodermatophilus obscurus]SHN51025.1 pyridoxamine 5'-phosphate oxidase family protein [Geodermatophilus obscurus]